MSSAEVVLKETAVVRVGSVRIGCGNVWEREQRGADGSTTSAMSARLAIGGEAHIVWVGSQLTIDGARYRVVAIDKPPGGLGRVRLAREATD